MLVLLIVVAVAAAAKKVKEIKPIKTTSTPLLPDEDSATVTCAVCREKLETFWDDKAEAWLVKDAIRSSDDQKVLSLVLCAMLRRLDVAESRTLALSPAMLCRSEVTSRSHVANLRIQIPCSIF